jgi:predicted SprT family Zn-dependent metalloprotease
MAYNQFNDRLFEGSLPPVIFTVQRKPGVMGYFAGDRWSDTQGCIVSEIAINPSYIASSRLIEVMQTLVHEMVHCWQHFHGNPGRKYYHNLEWAKKMIEVGLMPSSTGEPGGKITGQFMGDYILEDGCFLKVFTELEAKQELRLAWVDRKALPRLYEPVIAGLAPDTKTANILATKGAEVGSADNMRTLIATNADSDSYQVRMPVISAVTEGNQLLPNSLHLHEAPKKKTRIRYQCPGCDVIVYGRPKLNLMCGDCNCHFEGELII